MSSNIPTELKYTSDHEWAKVKGETATIGITDFAQSQLGDIVFVELPEVGTTLNKGAIFGVVESIKSVSDLYSPLTCEVMERNDAIEDSPELLNEDSYEAWLIKVKISNPEELNELIDHEEYKKVTEDQ